MTAVAGPDIDGLTFLEHLGSGGYSDVFLYERQRPRMRVAVKVLSGSRFTEAELAQFEVEAETMAELADHPYIVQVFWTGTTADGRPYLVMKYYPPPNLGRRAEMQRFAVADVLRTGIQIGSAVETAHRAGILHRDIKPANILISQYNEPGLTDFGIAGRTVEPQDDEDLGVSIPWSPPEVTSGASNGSAQSDVYSLAATVWHLLAGRSPFEIRGGDNSARAIMGRVLRAPPPATGRADVPASLERLLQQAMAKAAAHRPRTALEFTRGLQAVEQELRFARTEIIVEDLSARRRDDTAPSSADATRMRASKPGPIHPQASAAPPVVGPPRGAGVIESAPWAPSTSPPAPSPTPAAPPTAMRPARPSPAAAPSGRASGGQGEAAPVTVQRPARPPGPSAGPDVTPPSRRGRIRRSYLIAGIALVAVLVPVVAVVASESGGGGTPSPTTAPSGNKASNQGGLGGAQTSAEPPTVTPSYDVASHTLTFSWPAPAAGTTSYGYAYLLYTPADRNPVTHRTFATKVTATTTDPTSVCISVGAVQANGKTLTGGEQVCGTR